jgi:predicted PurR-regulated permease PerM
VDGSPIAETLALGSKRIVGGPIDLTRQTVSSVTLGILGVALIRSALAGVGLLVAGVPAAGLWALLVLLFTVVQIPTVLVLGPIIVYVFATSSTGAQPRTAGERWNHLP